MTTSFWHNQCHSHNHRFRAESNGFARELAYLWAWSAEEFSKARPNCSSKKKTTATVWTAVCKSRKCRTHLKTTEECSDIVGFAFISRWGPHWVWPHFGRRPHRTIAGWQHALMYCIVVAWVQDLSGKVTPCLQRRYGRKECGQC